MSKRVILSESQFIEYMRLKMNEAQDNLPREIRKLEIEEIKALLKRMVDDDFLVYFPNYSKQYTCSSLNDKGEVFEAVCTSYPSLLTDGNIGVSNDKYGNFEIENIINIQK